MLKIITERMVEMSTKEKIINAACRLFAEKGECLSVSEISEAVGIRKSTLYSHFESKDEILFEAFRQEINDYYSFLEKIIQKRDNDYDMEEFSKNTYISMLEYFKSKEKLIFWKRIFLLNPGTFNEKTQLLLENLFAKRTEYIEMIINKGIESENKENMDMKHLKNAYFIIIDGTLTNILINGYKEMELSFDVIWRIFWSGINETVKIVNYK